MTPQRAIEIAAHLIQCTCYLVNSRYVIYIYDHKLHCNPIQHVPEGSTIVFEIHRVHRDKGLRPDEWTRLEGKLRTVIKEGLL